MINKFLSVIFAAVICAGASASSQQFQPINLETPPIVISVKKSTNGNITMGNKNLMWLSVAAFAALAITRSMMDSAKEVSENKKLVAALKGLYPHRLLRDGILKSLIFNGNKKRKLISFTMWTCILALIFEHAKSYRSTNPDEPLEFANELKKDLEKEGIDVIVETEEDSDTDQDDDSSSSDGYESASPAP
ncbi:hypothetical protein HOD08_00310 [bacterium]|nr:hypothetical protein [bacterium]